MLRLLGYSRRITPIQRGHNLIAALLLKTGWAPLRR
jgi:hypothetical protein